MNHRIGGSSARRAPLLARLSAAATIGACGCAAFTNPPLASFREPAAQMARALASKAEKPVFRESIPAEALFDVRIAGNRALLDYRTEGTGLGGFDALPACGPLELRDVASNERIWSVDRSGACDDVVLAILPRLLVRGLSDKGEPELTARALDSGKLVARAALTQGALALSTGDGVIVVEGAAGAQEVSLLAADDLSTKWREPLGDAGLSTHALTLGGSVLVLGKSVTAFDRASGRKTGSGSLSGDAAVLDVQAFGDSAYALFKRGKEGLSLARIGPDAKVIWTAETGMVDAVVSGVAITVRGREVKALRADGTVAWTAQLTGPVSGSGLVVPRGAGSLWLVPHARGVTAFDAASGAVKFEVAPFGEAESAGGAPPSDRLFAAGPDRVVLDSARGVAGLDLAGEGRPRWVIPQRAGLHVTRAARLSAAYGTYDFDALHASARAVSDSASAQIAAMSGLSSLVGSMSGVGSGGFASPTMSFGDPAGAANNQMLAGSVQMSIGAAQASMAASAAFAAYGAANFGVMMSSIQKRKAQQATVALRQARLDEESDYLLRPLSWATGRGILVIRKTDGAFREIVTGPPDVYEDDFRPASVAAFVPLPKRIVTFSEGVDPALWADAAERNPVHLVQRALLGYALDEGALHPASDYERTTIVPAAHSPSKSPAPTNTARAPEPTSTAPKPPEPTNTARAPEPTSTAPKAPPTATATARAPATATPTSPPAAPTCKTRFDCKGGLVCQASRCVAPACVADKDCGSGKYCSLEGACEPVAR